MKDVQINSSFSSIAPCYKSNKKGKKEKTMSLASKKKRMSKGMTYWLRTLFLIRIWILHTSATKFLIHVIVHIIHFIIISHHVNIFRPVMRHAPVHRPAIFSFSNQILAAWMSVKGRYLKILWQKCLIWLANNCDKNTDIKIWKSNINSILINKKFRK